MKNKLKMIKINAFRAYKDEQKFDFRYNEDEIANLVLIYGPNGFGKTSFFDAVEWGFTGKIGRISNNSLIEKTVDYEKGYILKNRDSELKNGEVIFESENGDKLIRQTVQLNKKTKKDYLVGSKEFEGDAFKGLNAQDFYSKHILAYDQIDAFLRATTPESRYKELITFWGGDEDSVLYEQILKVCKISQDKIAKQKQIIIDVENEIKQISNSYTKISVLNEYIAQLNNIIGNQNKIKVLNKDFEEEEFLELQNSVITMKSEADEEYKKLTTDMIEFEFLKNNYRENLLKTEKYSQNKIAIEKINERLKDSLNLNKLIDELKKLDVNMKGIRLENDKCKFLILNWDKYINYVLKISNLDKDNILSEKNILSNEMQINDIDKKNQLRTDSIKSCNAMLNKYRNKLANIDEYLLLLKSKSTIDNRVRKLTNIVNLRIDKISAVKVEEARLKTYLEALENDYEINDVDIKYNEKYITLRDYQVNIKKMFKNLGNLRQNYYNLGELEKELKLLVNSGRSYIEKTKEKTCPLCNAGYNNYEILIGKINEKISDKIKLESLKEEIDKLEYDYNESNSIKDKIKSQLIEEIKLDLHHHIEKRNLYGKKSIKSESQRTLYITNRNICTERLEQLSKIYDSEEISIIESKLEVELLKEKLFVNETNISKKIINLNNEIETSLGIKKELVEKIRTLKDSIQLNKYSVKEIKQNELMKKYDEFSLENKIVISKELILEKISAFEKQLKERYQKFSEISKNKDELSKKIEGVKAENLNEEKTSLNIQNDDMKKDIDEYTRIFNNHYTDEFSTFNEGIAQESINVISEKQRNIIKINTTIAEVLNSIDYLINCLALSEKRLKMKSEIEYFDTLIKKNDELKKLRDLSSDFISKKINAAFDVDLINQIYSKIEPHPNLKSIAFEPIYQDDEKPKINIYATSSEGERAEPTLFLSAAQLNILSLSIFFARSLRQQNTKFGSIFMDDTIEHLDSINILSFIDLIRNIITNLDIQVIIATHDENLFNLFRRKIDPKYYRAKYLRLEGYGVLEGQGVE